jgi:curli biogenesis system outer membrane secretion channel CsgG
MMFSNRFRLNQSVRRRLIVLSLAAGTITAGGCSSASMSDAGLTRTAKAVETPVFHAPYDPQMGTIVLSVPTVDVSAPEACRLGNLGQTVRSQLLSSLSASGNFAVADRQVMADIAAEQRLNAANATVPSGRPLMGRLAAPRYLVKITVNEFKEAVQGRSQGGRIELGTILGIAGSLSGHSAAKILNAGAVVNPTIGNANDTVEGVVGMEVRVIDIQTGTVIGQTRAVGKLTRQNSSTVLGIAGITTSDSRFSESVLAQATRVAVEEATVQIHTLLRGRGGITESTQRTTNVVPEASVKRRVTCAL